MDKTKFRGLIGAIAVGATAVLLAACSGDDGAPGPAGPPGAPGAPGQQGPAGVITVTVPGNTTAATGASTAAWAALAPKASVTSVSISSPPVVNFTVTTQDGTPIVGLGSTSKRLAATKPGYTNLSFALAKLVPGTNGAPSKWVSYIVTTVPTYKSATDQTIVPSAPTRPTTDNTGTLVDHGDGTYTYTFDRDITTIKDQVAAMTVAAPNNIADLGDLTYDPNAVHRLTIQISGNAPGTGNLPDTGSGRDPGNNTPNGQPAATAGVPMTNPINIIYDFIPATGAPVAASGREIVATANCNACHRVLSGIPGDTPGSSAALFHDGARNDVRYCVVCHTEQRKYGQPEATINAATLTFTSASTYRVDGRAVGNLPNHIHHIHAGPMLAKKGYNYAGVLYNETLYPQDLRNCTTCHDNSSAAPNTTKTAQGDNWKNVPSRVACGGCHDGINFDTGKGVTMADAAADLTSSPYGHPGGAQADDTKCALCHSAAAIDTVYHLPVTPPAPGNALALTGGTPYTNAAWLASGASVGRLPAGAITVGYDIKSVSVNASNQPVMVFCIKLNGACTAFNTFDPTKAVGTQEIFPNFFGSPSLNLVFAVPQDGITAPADFNASVSASLRSLWNGKATGTGAGTLSAPDANNYYTATLTGVTIPANAKMLTGGLGFDYTLTSSLPLTQSNLADYPVTPATATGLNPNMPNLMGGLIVIAPNAQKVATGYTGRRPIVENARCQACHQQLGPFTEEAFHAGQRNDGTTCAWCHTPNQNTNGWSGDSTSYIHAIHAAAKRTVPFNWHAASATEGFFDIGFPGVLRDCQTCHLPGTYDFSAAASKTALPNRLYRAVATGTPAAGVTISPYVIAGNNYGGNFSFSAATGVTTAAAATTLVNSPIATACFACHDDKVTTSHMQANGASIYTPRSTALGQVEQCMVCHGPGSIADIAVVHRK